MEALIALVVLGLASLALLSPVLAVVALVRGARLERKLGELRREVEKLQSLAPQPARVAMAPPQVSAAAVPPPPPPRVVSPAGVTPQPVQPEPAQPRPPIVPARRPEIPPAPPPAPPPAGPSFDWEKLLGLRGAAIAGAITLVIAAVLLARLAIASGYITPEIRVVLMVLAGVGGLAWAELSLRRGYATTANAVSGAGIAVLYVAFFAAHSLYGLLPLGLTFGLMALVTVVAGLLSIRYDALPTAVLGLLGGFATPIALSTGADRPIGLFSYILLLNVGLAAIALRRRWHGLVLLSLAGTFLIEIGWFGRFMAPEKMLVGLSAFLLFGLFFLFLPLLGGKSDDEALVQTGAAGALAPLFFAVLLASNARFADEWPLLFGYLGLLDVALIAVALRRGRLELLMGASAATALTLPLWATSGLNAGTLWGSSFSAIALCLALNLVPRLAGMWAPGLWQNRRPVFEWCGAFAAAGLGVFALILVGAGLGDPPWAFATMLVALAAILVERSGEHRLPGALVLGAVALALVTQVWFFAATHPATLVRNLSLPLLLAVGLSLLARWRAAGERAPRAAHEDEAGAVAAALAAFVGLFGCLRSQPLGADPRPLFAALATLGVLLVVSALRRGWSSLVLLALLCAAVFATAWQALHYQADDVILALGLHGALWLGFLVLPLGLPERLAASWRGHAAPWLASALSGPFFFLALYDTITRAWGKAWIGALPVTLAGFTVAALAGVSRRFPVGPADAAARRRRLDYLALFASIALGFVALAIPLQLDRQWITVAWALEAMAVWWLFGKLPHPGLKLFGACLYACVGVRLLPNVASVLDYEPRGLPILNWLLYTYGVPAASCLLGAAFLRKADAETRLAPAASLLGLLLIFALINLEIVDYFSEGPRVALRFARHMARDLTMSLAWGLYALVLLMLGMWRRAQPLRLLSLGFLVLTIGKVFLFDLANLGGIYRILSFLGLGISLIVVSLLYQRFVFRKQAAS